MRVLQAMAGAEYGGAEAFFTRLVLALNAAGLEQRAVIRRHETRAATLRAGGVDTVQLPFGGAFDLQTRLGLRREIKNFHPDVVVTWMNRATMLNMKGRFKWVGRLGGYYDLKYYQRCDHLIGNTEDIVRHIVENGWPAERAHYLPNFVSEKRMAPLSRRQFYTPDNMPLLLAMGRLHPNKGFDILLHALVHVPSAYLWIAGAGPLQKELEELAQHLAVKPRVRFLGWRDDVAALFATCDVFVCPSRHEPLGNVVIEAWAHGVPVIAAGAQGPKSLIENMENGILVPVDDASMLSQAISYLLEDREARRRIGEGGRQAYQARFTEATVVDRYLTFFRRIST